MNNKLIFMVSHYAPSVVNFRGPLIHDILTTGAQVKVLAPDWSTATRATVESLGAGVGSFTLSRTGLNPAHDIKTFFSLLRCFRVEKPDVVFTYAAKTNVWGMLAAACAGVPHRVAMVEGMGYAFTEAGHGRNLKQSLVGFVLGKLYRLAFAMAHRVVFLNPDDQQEITQLCKLKINKSFLLGGIGVPLVEWPQAPAHTNPITFTLIARLLREKGIFEFLQAASVVKAKHPDVRFCLLGGLDANPGAISAEDIAPWIQAGTVEWPGQVQVKPWLEQTSVFVLPSYREGVPRSTQEAMAMGRPVITTDVPGYHHFIARAYAQAM